MIKSGELVKWYEEKKHYFKKFFINPDNNKFYLELIGLENAITEKDLTSINSIEELERYIKYIFDIEIKNIFKNKNKQPLSA
ncbi:hypothetical protein XO10_00950 [Marinitoga sp. 1135]|uniref:Uncharacterized protein n=1 Tax=Marinitoga piezophila (strain DSM 14283 / JCM 11233 / KA3) TaxID=443254 RepID=H2J370_MARPK|nr:MULTISPECIES: hypothetical protein [Marinitoga]AEX84588.1 hypothetical protein Marpi_0131 [Marinitoga piezophila KA3]APT75108.1 hypothetical protein LN42_00890 [Marinitoga sp. 1137]NUU94881.1 hypothetical protein [Marinitoga sp. 1135]NUU96819.1 hypothetical protein [Marinitoga sp. 1138]